MDLKQLFENAGIPVNPDFTGKVSTLFEASLNEAVEARVKAEVKSIQEASERKLDEAKAAWIAESEEDLEKFLDKEVKEWATANAAALTGSIKSSLAESILTKVKAVLESEGITMPDEKESAIKEAEEKEAELKEELEDVKKELEESKKVIQGYTMRAIIAEATKGVSKVAAGKIASLSENISFKNARQYAGAVAAITEGVAGKRLKIKENAEAASKFPATSDNSNAAGADKNKAAVDIAGADNGKNAVNEDGAPDAASKFPATSDNSNAAGSDKNKAAVDIAGADNSKNAVVEATEGSYFEDDDEEKTKVDEKKKPVSEDVGVDNVVNGDGKGDPDQEPKAVNEAFDSVALFMKSLKKV